MTGKIGLTDVMDAIYFASHQKDGWQDCLDLISKISGGETSQLLMLNKDSGQLVAAYQSRIPAMQGQDHDEPVVRLCDVRYELNGALIQLMVERPAGQGEFNTEERRFIEGVVPHIARALRQEEAARVLNDRQAAVHRQKQGALLLLDGQLNVVFLSAEAELLLSRTALVKLEAGRLRLAQRKKEAELDGLIQRCFESKASGMISLKGAGQADLRLLVSTVQPRDERLFLSHGLVAVFIVGDDSVEESSKETLICQWLGLTESESRIASAIAQGRKPVQIADDLQLSVHTVRHHIKNIYRKTGVHSQSQLTALVLNLPA